MRQKIKNSKYHSLFDKGKFLVKNNFRWEFQAHLKSSSKTCKKNLREFKDRIWGLPKG